MASFNNIIIICLILKLKLQTPTSKPDPIFYFIGFGVIYLYKEFEFVRSVRSEYGSIEVEDWCTNTNKVTTMNKLFYQQKGAFNANILKWDTSYQTSASASLCLYVAKNAYNIFFRY